MSFINEVRDAFPEGADLLYSKRLVITQKSIGKKGKDGEQQRGE
jgi:hypothetical protein